MEPIFSFVEHDESKCLLWFERRINLVLPEKIDIHFVMNQLLNTINVLFIPCFVFGFWSLLAKKFNNMKLLRNLSLHFARQDGQDGRKRNATKVTKIPKYQKPKTKNMGWTKQKFHLVLYTNKKITNFHEFLRIITIFLNHCFWWKKN